MSRNSIRPLVDEEEGTANNNPPAYKPVQRPSTVTMEMMSTQNGVPAEPYDEKPEQNGHQNPKQFSSINSMGTEETCISSQDGGSTDKIIAGDVRPIEGDMGKMELYQAMSPMIRCMEIFGVWHSDVIAPERKLRRKSFCNKIFNIYNYSILVLILLWLNLLRWLPSFFVGSNLDPSRLYFKVIYLAFLLQCALNHSVIFWITSKPDRIAAFFQHWEKIQNHPDTAVNLAWVHKRAKIFAVLGCIYVFLHFLNQTSSVFSPIESMYNSSQIFVAPFEPNPIIHIVIILMNIFDFATWIFSIFIFMIFAMTLRHQFENILQRIEASITDATNRGVFPEDFETLRRQHTDLCVAVQKANHGLFTYLNIITYATMVPLACFLLYQLLFSGIDGDNVSAFLMYTIWILSIFINVCVVSWIAALTSSTVSISCYEMVIMVMEVFI